MRAIVLKIKALYDKGAYKIEVINKLLEAGKITQEEYIYIVGENK